MATFDKPFPGDIKGEFDSRAKSIANKGVKWNYDKYAYCTIKSTGNSQTIIKAEAGLTLGDGADYIRNSHIGLYNNEGGVRKFKPQLKSCKITNEGGQDYTDSYIYNVEFAFTVFTKDDLDLAEKSFFRVGGEIEVDFGWRKYSSGPNSGTVTANIFNYDFSMNEDGSFDCTVKAMSPAALWSGEDMGSTTTKEVDGEEEVVNFLSDLEASCRESFGLDADDGPDSVDDLGNNKLRIENISSDGVKCTFGAAELIIEPGFWNDDEQYIFYTTIGTLIRYINSKGDDNGNKYKISTDPATSTWPKIKGLGSADPKDFFLPGNQGSYGDPSDGGNAKNFSEWGGNLWAKAIHDMEYIGAIAVSFPFLTKVYQGMADKTKTVGGFKQSVKIAEFLKEVFARLENLTGGLVTLAAVPMKDGKNLQPDNQKPPFDITIMNKKMIEPAPPEPYTFNVLAKDSITKSVSLSSDFDSDYVLMATKANIEKGTSNGHMLTKPEGPYPQNGDVTPSKDNQKSESDLLDMRNKIGDKGASPERLTAYGDACRAFIIREAKGNDKLAKGRYSEIQYTLNLSVTTDGVWGIPFLAPITVDRLPQVFKDAKVVFSVTAVNHEFDGKGGWETSMETVMRIP
jgi:hypothetical protein